MLFIAALCIIVDHVWALITWFWTLSFTIKGAISVVLVLCLTVPLDMLLNRNRSRNSS